MVTYIYFVKCPNCDDEHFDFFDEAKEFALGCLSQKPIITQTEVCRNDFGECTDSADLGTVWSWEDIMGNDADRELISENALRAGGFRTDGYRTALACYDSDDFDINVEFGMQDEEEYEVEDQVYLLCPGQTVADLVVYLSRECGFTSVYVYGETSATRAEMKTATRFTTVPGNHDYRHYGTIEDRLVEARDRKPISAGTVFSKAETFGISEGLNDFDDFDIGPQIDEFDNSLDFDLDDDSTDTLWVAENLNGGDIVAACWADSESTAYNLLTAAFRERTGGDPRDCYIYQAETSDVEYVNANPELLAESQERKPIPDGMTIEQLVEEMEENEDTVECTRCEDLFDKSECRKEVNLGWLCGRCEAAIKSRGEPLTFRENNYWDFLDDETNELTEGTLTEAAGFDCPKLREAENNQPGIAKFKILSQFRRNPDVQGDYGDCPYLSGVSVATATFKGVILRDSTRAFYGEIHDIELADNGEVVLTTTNNKKYSLKQALKIASPATVKFSNTRTVLLALKAAAEAAEKTLSTKTVRNLRVRNALASLDATTAEEFKTHIKNITFRIPAHNAYSANDILDIDPDASEQQAEMAAEKINKIHDDFYSLPFAQQAEAEGMVEERIPTEKAGWILSSWGAVGKIRFDCPVGSLSDEAQAIIKKAKLSEGNVKTEALEVDCYRLATELIKFFDNDPKFYEKATVTEAKELHNLGNEYDGGYPAETPEVSKSYLKFCPECGKDLFDIETGICVACGFN